MVCGLKVRDMSSPDHTHPSEHEHSTSDSEGRDTHDAEHVGLKEACSQTKRVRTDFVMWKMIPHSSSATFTDELMVGT